ncbi:hypothetical protein HNQ59_002023 [Chitinivorax tropicus]|uniref:Uncharacterized protein n=1 Tax=Chitinivorax tropicus TaxID=714531 RepID=A0A840MK07_9PROT|nr:hypothetical protein [Chitinivorax tropicus]
MGNQRIEFYVKTWTLADFSLESSVLLRYYAKSFRTHPVFSRIACLTSSNCAAALRCLHFD